MKGSAKYRKMQNNLDKIGLHTNIIKIDNKAFAFIVNFETIKVFKKRDSINKRIIQLHKTKYETL